MTVGGIEQKEKRMGRGWRLSIGLRLLLVAGVGLLLLVGQSALALRSSAADFRHEATAQASLLARSASEEIQTTLDSGNVDFAADTLTPEGLCELVGPFVGETTIAVTTNRGEALCQFGDLELLGALLDPISSTSLGGGRALVETDEGFHVLATLATPAGLLRYPLDVRDLEPSILLSEHDDVEVILVAGTRILGAWPIETVAVGTDVGATRLPIEAIARPTTGQGLTGTPRIFARHGLGDSEVSVIVGLDQAGVDHAIAQARRDGILSVGVGTVILIVMVLLTSRSIARPILQFTAALRSHRGPNLPQLEVRGPTEVQELVERFNELSADAGRSTERLAFLAHHDPLTGLRNQFRIRELLANALDTAAPGETLSVVQIDLDDFTAINQSYGPEVGDAMLAQIGRRLDALSADDLVVGRLAGDEFIVFGPVGPQDLRKLVHRVLATVNQSVVVDGIAIECSAAAGATAAVRGADVTEVFSEAARALEQAKRLDQSFVIHDEELRAQNVERARLAHDLRDALDHDGVDVAFQAVTQVSTGRIVGFEALARWTHPVEGPIQPTVFVPVAERSGLIADLGLAMLRKSCAVVSGWHHGDAGLVPSVSVNVSGRQLANRDFPEQVLRVLHETDLAPHALTLEVTESVILADLHAMIDRLSLIRGLGVRIALDDFGTGYSSLSYLARLPLDIMKIDRMFLESIETDPRAQAVLAAIVDLGRAADLAVVCEGVETDEQLAKVREVGVDLVQGYLFHQPDTNHGRVFDRMLLSAGIPVIETT